MFWYAYPVCNLNRTQPSIVCHILYRLSRDTPSLRKFQRREEINFYLSMFLTLRHFASSIL